jgi:hypothetical protein
MQFGTLVVLENAFREQVKGTQRDNQGNLLTN